MKTTSVDHGGNLSDYEYSAYLVRLQERLDANTKNGTAPVFTTNVEGLWGIYLRSFKDLSVRQHHNCHACRRFIETYGGLVTIDDFGQTKSAIWDEEDAPKHYRSAVQSMLKAIARAKVTGVFLSSEKRWGTLETGPWVHLSVAPDRKMVFSRTTQTAGQAMAEKREDYLNVCRALREFKKEHVEMAVTLLKTDALYRSEKVLGQAEWLLGLFEFCEIRSLRRDNLVRRAVATAPAGFCHPRSSMIGTLLEDIAAGMSFEDASRKFAAKMHPLRYQRPQAAPTAGAIQQAEKVVDQLGAAGSLDRRFCRVDEVDALWRPAPPKEERKSKKKGVFSDLKPKGALPEVKMKVPSQTMTWEKFQREVLPTAERIALRVPYIGSYAALVTAANADAPPILQWDREERRNPVSHYMWMGGSRASQWGLESETWVEAEAVCYVPSMWYGVRLDHFEKGVMFVLAGAKETRFAGAAIFPEDLRSEFHGVRSVLEAYSRLRAIDGMDEPHAAGLLWHKDSDWGAEVRVWVGSKHLDYKLDRWD